MNQMAFACPPLDAEMRRLAADLLLAARALGRWTVLVENGDGRSFTECGFYQEDVAVQVFGSHQAAGERAWIIGPRIPHGLAPSGTEVSLPPRQVGRVVEASDFWNYPDWSGGSNLRDPGTAPFWAKPPVEHPVDTMPAPPVSGGAKAKPLSAAAEARLRALTECVNENGRAGAYRRPW